MSNAAPMPIGVGASFSRTSTTGGNTNSFGMDKGWAVMTFQPVDVNDPGVATLYNSSAEIITTMDREGWANVFIPAGTYYFSSTKGANLMALTNPSIGSR